MTALVVTPHPMTVQGQRILDAQAAALVPGETLAVFLERHGVVVGQQWVVCIGGIEVLEAHWHRIRPKDGHLIEARRVPQKDALRLVATIALAYFTFGAGGVGASGLFGTGASAYLAAGVAYMAGSLIINKLLGPKPMKAAALAAPSPTYSLTGGRNRMRPWEPMGLVLGEPYCVPDLASQPYTYFANGEQFLWQIFHCGLNCASVSSIRVGQTAISAYQGVTLSYAGFTSGNTGLPALGTSVDTVAGALLDAPAAPGAWTTRTSSVDTMQLVVDIEGSLFNVSDKGAYINALCEIEIEYRAVGSGTWLKFGLDTPYTVNVPAVFSGGGPESDYYEVSAAYSYSVTPTTIGLNNASTKPLRQSFQRTVSPGQYEVRARKATANAGGNAQNQISWTALKSFQVDNGSYSGEARLGVQIQASGQLNGALDELNLVATMRPCPYWNGSAWVTATNRATGLCNPGALILLLARGVYDDAGRLVAGLGWADAQIDIEGLKLFMVRCAAKGFQFDYFLQETVGIGDLLESIAAAGMGAISHHPGTLSVVWFSESDPVESVLNMGAMKARSFTVDYDTQATADELEYQYFDRERGNAWKPVRVLAPGVTVPTITARQQLMGITSEAHAAVLARFAMAQNVYGRQTVTCEVDLEHLTFRRGTVMAISHDLTQWGYGGRVQAASNASGIVTLTLDDVVPEVSPSGASTHYVGLRLAGETQYRVFGCSMAHRNLLTYSEQFNRDYPAWNKLNISVTSNAVADVNGEMLADILTCTSTFGYLTQFVIGFGALVPYSYSIDIKAPSPITIVMSTSEDDGGAGTYNPVPVNLTTSWQRFTISGVTISGSSSLSVQLELSTGQVVHVARAALVREATPGAYERTPGNSRQLKLDSVWPGGVAVPGDSSGNPAHDCLWIYDFKSTPGKKMRVAEISPQGNMDGARVALVPESEEFWTYVWTGAYTPPPNNSLLQTTPVLDDVVVTEHLRRQGTSFYTELALTFSVSGAYDRAELWGTVGDGVPRLLGSTRGLSVLWQGGLREIWALELRPYSAIYAGEPYRFGYIVGGLSVEPEQFDFFTVTTAQSGARQYDFGYTSADRQPVDWLGAEIRYVVGVDPAPVWAAMLRLQSDYTYFSASPAELGSPEDAGTYTFACKSLDTSGNASAYLLTTVTLPATDARLLSRPNLLPNGGFEHGTTGWSLGGGGLTVIDGVWGRVLQKIDSFSGTSAVDSDAFRVQAGASYVVTGDSLLFATSGSVYFDLLFYNADMTMLLLDGPQNPVGPHDFINDDTHRNEHAVAAVAPSVAAGAPADAVWAVARFIWSSVVGGTAVGCRQVKVERGALPATRYSSETGLVSAFTTATAASTAAAAAQTAANTAQTAANTANSVLANIASDNVLSKGEKPAVVLDWTAIYNEQPGIDGQAASYGITTARTNYNNAISTLGSYLIALSPNWADVTQDTPITGSTFRANFADVYYRRQLLLDQIAAVAKSLADAAQSTADAAALVAAAAHTAATNAQTTANAAHAELVNIASDGVLSPVEKPEAILRYTEITSQQTGIDTQATAYGITTQKTAYDSAVTALTAYLATLTSPVAWNNTAGDTSVVRTTFIAAFDSVYSTRQALLNQIAAVAGTLAVWGNVSGSGKPANNATVGASFGVDISGQINTSNISTYVGAQAVNTPYITDHAVAAQVGAAAGGAVTATSSWVTILTAAAVDVGSAGDVALIVTVDFINGNSGGGGGGPEGDASATQYTPQYRILRNGSTVVAAWQPVVGVSAAFTSRNITSYTALDAPGSGSTVYTLQHRDVMGTYGAQSLTRSLITIGRKK